MLSAKKQLRIESLERREMLAGDSPLGDQEIELNPIETSVVLVSDLITGDLNGDQHVDGLDLGILLGNWGVDRTAGQGDLNGDEKIDSQDLGHILSNYGSVKDDLSLDNPLNRVTAWVSSDGVLSINGTSNDDSITAYQQNGIVVIDGVTTQWEVEQLQAIFIAGHEGDDEITINLQLPSKIEGGDGNDTIIGSEGDDKLYGGNGNDRLEGHGGFDLIVGGIGTDNIDGGNGEDRIYGDTETTATDGGVNSTYSIYASNLLTTTELTQPLHGIDGWTSSNATLSSADEHIPGGTIDGFQQAEQDDWSLATRQIEIPKNAVLLEFSFDAFASTGNQGYKSSHNSGVGIQSWGEGPSWYVNKWESGWVFDVRGLTGDSSATELIHGGFDEVTSLAIIVDIAKGQVWGKVLANGQEYSTRTFEFDNSILAHWNKLFVGQDWRDGSGGIKVGNIRLQAEFDNSDRISGGQGADTIYGGAGNDTIYADLVELPRIVSSNYEVPGIEKFEQLMDVIRSQDFYQDSFLSQLLIHNLLEQDGHLIHYADLNKDNSLDLLALDPDPDQENNLYGLHVLSGASGYQVPIEHIGIAALHAPEDLTFDSMDVDSDLRNDLLVYAATTSGEEPELVDIISGKSDFKVSIFNGGSSLNTVYGGEGNDAIYGSQYRDILFGEEGADVLDGSWGADLLLGGDGNDLLDGGTGRDRVFGLLGDDKFIDNDYLLQDVYDNDEQDQAVPHADVRTMARVTTEGNNLYALVTPSYSNRGVLSEYIDGKLTSSIPEVESYEVDKGVLTISNSANQKFSLPRNIGISQFLVDHSTSPDDPSSSYDGIRSISGRTWSTNELESRFGGPGNLNAMLGPIGELNWHENGEKWVGSGTLLELGGRRLVLTAGHNVDGNISNLKFTPSIYSKSGIGLPTPVDIDFWYGPEYFGNRDIALLVLEEPLNHIQGALLNNHPGSYSTSITGLQNKEVLLAGYGQRQVRSTNGNVTNYDAGELAVGFSTIDSVDPLSSQLTLIYDDPSEVITSGGDSGLSYLDAHYDEVTKKIIPVILGVHSKGNFDPIKKGHVLNTSDKYNATGEYMDTNVAKRILDIAFAHSQLKVNMGLYVTENGDGDLGDLFDGGANWKFTLDLDLVEPKYIDNTPITMNLRNVRDGSYHPITTIDTLALRNGLFADNPFKIHLSLTNGIEDDGDLSFGDDDIPSSDLGIEILDSSILSALYGRNNQDFLSDSFSGRDSSYRWKVSYVMSWKYGNKINDLPVIHW